MDHNLFKANAALGFKFLVFMKISFAVIRGLQFIILRALCQQTNRVSPLRPPGRREVPLDF